MLKQLRINHIILIETAEIDFAGGFNVLSGETGSGKSAIMNAISLITGERAETSMIRKGAEKGIVEAVFDIKGIQGISTLLEQCGIDCAEDEELFIRREVSAAGKSRAFINNQLAQLNTLKYVCALLINIVGQHANQDLFSLERHRDIVDVFGGLKSDAVVFSKGWEEENAIQNELEALMTTEAQRLREAEVCQRVLEELEEANLKEGEDDELFKEYTLLVHAEEIGVKVNDICQMLNGERNAILSNLHRQKNQLEDLVRIDSSLTDVAQSFQNAVLEIQEAANTLTIYQSRLEHNPERLAEVNDRLTLITRLKKKYGNSLQEIQAFAQANQKRLDDLQNADQKIQELQEQLERVKTRNQQQASQLTQKRQKAAEKLATALKRELRSLNMPQVDFEIDVTPQKRSRWGDDRIEFFLLPNVGERRIAVKDCASGGELSRVMLALQTVLSGKECIPTLVFDEIDANIGGETAKVVGEKLKGIGQKQQVLCITHFPQVAKYADHHLQISKKVVDDRTVTFISLLDASMREQEMARMSGNI
jgi:DNA repair protein RecN (Recombination protein N)